MQIADVCAVRSSADARLDPPASHPRSHSLALSLGVHKHHPNRCTFQRRKGRGQPPLNGAAGEVARAASASPRFPAFRIMASYPTEQEKGENKTPLPLHRRVKVLHGRINALDGWVRALDGGPWG